MAQVPQHVAPVPQVQQEAKEPEARPEEPEAKAPEPHHDEPEANPPEDVDQEPAEPPVAGEEAPQEQASQRGGEEPSLRRSSRQVRQKGPEDGFVAWDAVTQGGRLKEDKEQKGQRRSRETGGAEKKNRKGRQRQQEDDAEEEANVLLTGTFDNPRSVQEALTGPHSDAWWDAMKKEMNNMDSKRVLARVPRAAVPGDKKILTLKWVFAYKYNPDGTVEKCKARLVARGFEQRYGHDFLDIFAPVAQSKSYRALLAIIAEFGWASAQWDVDAAYLNAEVKEELYAYMPEGFDDKTGDVVRIEKALYGLKQAGNEWNNALNKTLTEDIGFRRLVCDPCVYVGDNGLDKVIIVLHVDDMMVGGTSDQVLKDVHDAINARYRLTDRGGLQWALGTRVTRDESGTVTLDQKLFVNSVLARFSMEQAYAASTPMKANQRLTAASCPLTEEEQREMSDVPYRAMIGSMMYAANMSRPDIAYAVNQCSRFASNPGQEHARAVKQVLRYLKETQDWGIKYKRTGQGLRLLAYTDADFAGDVESAKSTSGFVVFLAGGPVSWASRQQAVVAQSTAESEYIALAATANEVKWWTMLLAEIGFDVPQPVTILVDNTATKAMGENPVHHNRSKHINVKYHATRDYVKQGLIELQWVRSQDNVADILTKPLPRDTFSKCRGALIGEILQ